MVQRRRLPRKRVEPAAPAYPQPPELLIAVSAGPPSNAAYFVTVRTWDATKGIGTASIGRTDVIRAAHIAEGKGAAHVE